MMKEVSSVGTIIHVECTFCMCVECTVCSIFFTCFMYVIIIIKLNNVLKL